MRIFGIDITFVDRSDEDAAVLAMKMNECREAIDTLCTRAGGRYAARDQDAIRDFIIEKNELRREMINRGYLGEDDY